MEYVGGGSVASLVRAIGALPEKLAKKFTRDLLLGMDWIHNEAHIVHRDIKTENMLLDSKHGVKLTDYGTATRRYELSPTTSIESSALLGDQHQQQQRVDHNQSRRLHTACVGTANYMAPEIANNSEYSSSADVWSIGCSTYEMLVGFAPYTYQPTTSDSADGVGEDEDEEKKTKKEEGAQNDRLDTDDDSEEALAQQFHGNAFALMFALASNDKLVPIIPRKVKETVSAEAVDFVTKCCQRDPSKRPTVRELLRHQWVAFEQQHGGSGGEFEVLVAATGGGAGERQHDVSQSSTLSAATTTTTTTATGTTTASSLFSGSTIANDSSSRQRRGDDEDAAESTSLGNSKSGAEGITLPNGAFVDMF